MNLKQIFAAAIIAFNFMNFLNKIQKINYLKIKLSSIKSNVVYLINWIGSDFVFSMSIGMVFVPTRLFKKGIHSWANFLRALFNDL